MRFRKEYHQYAEEQNGKQRIVNRNRRQGVLEKKRGLS